MLAGDHEPRHPHSLAPGRAAPSCPRARWPGPPALQQQGRASRAERRRLGPRKGKADPRSPALHEAKSWPNALTPTLTARRWPDGACPRGSMHLSPCRALPRASRASIESLVRERPSLVPLTRHPRIPKRVEVETSGRRPATSSPQEVYKATPTTAHLSP
jgi:hypothetical protein